MVGLLVVALEVKTSPKWASPEKNMIVALQVHRTSRLIYVAPRISDRRATGTVCTLAYAKSLPANANAP